MDWKSQGIKIVRAGDLDTNTPQTAGMTRAAAITHARTGASKLWAGTVVVQPDVKSSPHHHGELETVLYVVRGRARMRWGETLEFSDEAGPGDFIYVPPFVPHQEINARRAELRAESSKVGQTIGLCRLSPLLLEPGRPQKTMVCPTCFHQFSKGGHPHCVQAKRDQESRKD
jgi:uncharacterized RmlC-like cupin family protein